ncbi:MAG: helix-turn-helix transcriptional regulator [Campylobacter sp.]|uniref:helix-turn-helix domain-containing protein n=1 Tax=Campylobacter sp. TaxID=205 RepID=UPI002A83C1DC|nr:helix-turn-helix transcriptional regulator [Campylobacter sp.]MCI7586429.1 helix-turn-helix domain-containing protein [Campylobacter sp.]MDY5115956.1 helix-turn-helix transcriptional regulator [Campylobacter sp.]MDY5384423.1 helix-turn-helix transcriptional regulator [Campylobacter sp.]
MKTHEKLAKMRKDTKLSRRELADISGFNEHTILAYERNQNPASNDYVKFCALYFGYELSSIQDNTKELEKMSENEQVLGIYKEIENCDFNGILENCDINTNDYTPSKYAEFVRLQSIMGKLEKSKQYAKQDLELLALLNSLNAEIKDSLKALIKSIIAKGRQ